MTRIVFTPEMQDKIYNQVFGNDRRWLSEAVAYVNRTRRGYPEDDPRWTEDTTIDHILYFIIAAKGLEKDATLDDRNLVVNLRRWLDNNPCILPEMPKPEPTPQASMTLDILTYDKENDQYDHVRATPEEHDEFVENKDQIDLDVEREINEALGETLVTDADARMIEGLLEPADEPASTPTPVKKKATKKKASKKKATKKKVTKKKSTKKKVSKKK